MVPDFLQPWVVTLSERVWASSGLTLVKVPRGEGCTFVSCEHLGGWGLAGSLAQSRCGHGYE